MRILFFAAMAALLLLASCASNKPNLGAIRQGYLVNVNSDGVALQGIDAVSLREKAALPGKPTITSEYHGGIYRFANEANKRKFDANPEAYEPEFGGYCAYGLAVGNLAPIELWTLDTVFNNHNIYNHNQKAVAGWEKDKAGNYEKAKIVWANYQKKFKTAQILEN